MTQHDRGRHEETQRESQIWGMFGHQNVCRRCHGDIAWSGATLVRLGQGVATYQYDEWVLLPSKIFFERQLRGPRQNYNSVFARNHGAFLFIHTRVADCHD